MKSFKYPRIPKEKRFRIGFFMHNIEIFEIIDVNEKIKPEWRDFILSLSKNIKIDKQEGVENELKLKINGWNNDKSE